MKRSPKIIGILTFFIFNTLYQITISSNICNSDYNCNNCEYCGQQANNYNSCFYYQMLCKENYVITYSPFIKTQYTTLFESDSEIAAFFGQKEYTLRDQENGFTLLNTQDKTFPRDKYIHCHYIINKEIENSSIDFKLSKNSKSNELRNLKIEISNIYSLSNGKEESESINHSRLRKYSSLNANLYDYKKVEIFVDFLELNYQQPEEIFEIVINLSNDNSDSSSSSNGGIIGGAIGGIAGLALIGGIAYCFCCKKETYIVEKKSYCIIF